MQRTIEDALVKCLTAASGEEAEFTELLRGMNFCGHMVSKRAKVTIGFKFF